MGWIGPTFFRDQMSEPRPPDERAGCFKDIGGAVLIGLIIGKIAAFILDALF
jgi:hypothetical protein